MTRKRAMVAARVATLPDGHRKSGAPIGAGVATQDDAAEMLNVGRRSVQRAREVLDHGAPELVAAVACRWHARWWPLVRALLP